MTRITMPRHGGERNVWIDLATGVINFPRAVMERLGWQIGQHIEVSYLLKPMVLLFRVDETGEIGYALHYLNRTGTGGSGGKIRCAKLARLVLRPRFSQPVLYGLEPIYPTAIDADLALFLERPDWIPIDFDMASCQAVSEDTLGVYEVLGPNAELRIGEGNVRLRLKEHLKVEALVRAAKGVRYFQALDKEDSVVLEHLLLSEFEARDGALPQYNRIKA